MRKVFKTIFSEKEIQSIFDEKQGEPREMRVTSLAKERASHSLFFLRERVQKGCLQVLQSTHSLAAFNRDSPVKFDPNITYRERFWFAFAKPQISIATGPAAWTHSASSAMSRTQHPGT